MLTLCFILLLLALCPAWPHTFSILWCCVASLCVRFFHRCHLVRTVSCPASAGFGCFVVKPKDLLNPCLRCCAIQFTTILSRSFTAARAEVQAKPAFLNKEAVQREVKAVLSQKATLSCEVVDNATEVKWYKDGKQLSPSRAVQVDSKGKIRQLVICNVDKKDAGEYTCEVGTEKLAFKVQVAGRR